MKIVLNECFGGFGISDQGIELWAKKKGLALEKTGESLLGTQYSLDGKLFIYQLEISREDSAFVEVVEEIGEKVNGFSSELGIVEIPDGCEYSIHEYDGVESIDQTWINVTMDDLKNGLSEEQLEMASKVSCIKIEEL
jgi:hypothetical protein